MRNLKQYAEYCDQYHREFLKLFNENLPSDAMTGLDLAQVCKAALIGAAQAQSVNLDLDDDVHNWINKIAENSEDHHPIRCLVVELFSAPPEGWTAVHVHNCIESSLKWIQKDLEQQQVMAQWNDYLHACFEALFSQSHIIQRASTAENFVHQLMMFAQMVSGEPTEALKQEFEGFIVDVPTGILQDFIRVNESSLAAQFTATFTGRKVVRFGLESAPNQEGPSNSARPEPRPGKRPGEEWKGSVNDEKFIEELFATLQGRMESLRKVWIGKVEKLEKLDRAMQKKNDERNRKAYQNQLESMTNVAKSGSFKGLTFEGNSVTEVRELVHGRLQSLEREFNKAFSEFYDCLGQPDRVSDVKRVRERLLNLSRVLAQDLDSMQRNIQGNVPKMSTSLFSGGKLYGGTSGGEKAKVENLHPLLQYLLAKVPESHKGKGHGGCAEIRVLSKYIHAWQRQNEKLLERKGISSDSYDALVKELRRHFERGGAITSAHFLGEDSIYGVAACETCRSVQEHLGVSWLPGEKDEEDRVTWYNQSSGKLVAARAGRDSPETPRRSTPHQRPMSAAADPAEGNPNGN